MGESKMQNGKEAITLRLAEKVLAFSRKDMTLRAMNIARTGIIDTIGVTLAGVPEDCTQILLRIPGVATAPGKALIFGSTRRTSALDAALINGTASHALDYDDFSSDFGGHQSVPLVAPLFALAEERGANGIQVMVAYAAGLEALIRLARAVNFVHYDKGWHPTATLGVFGAAAACGHLIGLDKARMATAFALAASMSSGLKANFGSMTKPFHVGHCARNGLLAALMAEQGFEARHGVMEHKQGFLDVYNGPGLHDAEKIFADWAKPVELEAPGIALKQFPCCASTHPAIAMMLKLVKEERITAADVAKIEILPHARRMPHTDNPWPVTPLQAKFSVQYGVVRALISGAPRIAHFEGTAALEPEVQRLLGLVSTAPHPEMPRNGADQWGAEVIVTTHDGRRLSRRVNQMVGRGGDNPMTSDELWEKFTDCAERGIPRENIAPLFDRLESLEETSDIGAITRLLESPEKTTAPRFAEVERDGVPLETSWVP